MKQKHRVLLLYVNWAEMVFKKEEKEKIILTLLPHGKKVMSRYIYNEMVNHVAITHAFAPICDLKTDKALIFGYLVILKFSNIKD